LTAGRPRSYSRFTEICFRNTEWAWIAARSTPCTAIGSRDPAAQDEHALSILDATAIAAARVGARLVIEPLSGADRYPIKTAADAFAVIDKVGRDNLALLFDLYHLGVNGENLGVVIPPGALLKLVEPLSGRKS
jgi:hydroxypyruvate isomerase